MAGVGFLMTSWWKGLKAGRDLDGELCARRRQSVRMLDGKGRRSF